MTTPLTTYARPEPGRTVLACRCGKSLDLADMRRMPHATGHRTPVQAIVCADCARSGWLRAGATW